MESGDPYAELGAFVGRHVGDFVYDETCSELLADLAEFGANLGTRVGAHLLQDRFQQWLTTQRSPRNTATIAYGFVPIYQTYEPTTF
jgi:hypothetical protein